MKTRFKIKHICLMVLIAGVLVPDISYAQSRPRLAQPSLIPGRGSRGPAIPPPPGSLPAAQPPGSLPASPPPAASVPPPAPSGAVTPAPSGAAVAPAPIHAPVPVAPAEPAPPLVPLEELFFAEDTLRQRGGTELTFVQPEAVPSRPQRKDAVREEMFARMRLAVESVAAEYGNPTFAEFFTNDTLRAKVFRQRLHLLRNYDKLQSELVELRHKKEAAAQIAELAVREQQTRVKNALASLEQEKQVLSADVAAKRDELKVLQEQVNTLSNKIKQAQVTLNSIQIK